MLRVTVIVVAASLIAAACVCAAESVGGRVEKFTISRDDSTYECFPSLTRCSNGRIILTYRESDGHVANEYCRIIVRTSDDGGATFSDRHVLIFEQKSEGRLMKYNCPKVQQLRDGRILIVCDRFPIPPGEDAENHRASRNVFWFSSDNGETWSGPVDTGVQGIMPDEVIELDNGDWLLATQSKDPQTRNSIQCVSRSSDGGKTWAEPVVVASKKGYNLCEASILKLPDGKLVCYMRENSGMGRPIYKSISADGGLSWQGPHATQMDSGHRPVAHLTQSGKVMVTYRYQIGGASPWAKNTFAYLESVESAAQPDRQKQCGVVMPLDHDRSPKSDGGYTGWVETAPGRFLVVNYIVDDAPKAQIRGYRFAESDF